VAHHERRREGDFLRDEPWCKRFRFGEREAMAVHAGVDVNGGRGFLAGGVGMRFPFVDFFHRAEHGPHADAANRFRAARVQAVQEIDRDGGKQRAQPHRFVEGGDEEGFRTRLCERARRLFEPDAIGVGLHDGPRLKPIDALKAWMAGTSPAMTRFYEAIRTAAAGGFPAPDCRSG